MKASQLNENNFVQNVGCLNQSNKKDDKMKVKCKICGRTGFFDGSKITEFWASRFLRLRTPKKKDILHGNFVCRKCVSAVLDALRSESYRIDSLYKPQISKPKEKEENV